MLSRSSGGGETRQQRRVSADAPEHFEDIEALLVHGRYITAYPAEHPGSRKASEPARHFLLYLGHPDITFRKVIAKWNLEVVQESKRLLLVSFQSANKRAALRVFLATGSRAGKRWVSFEPGFNRGIILP